MVPRLEVHCRSKDEAMENGGGQAGRQTKPWSARSSEQGVGTLSDPAVPLSCGAGRQGLSKSAPALPQPAWVPKPMSQNPSSSCAGCHSCHVCAENGCKAPGAVPVLSSESHAPDGLTGPCVSAAIPARPPPLNAADPGLGGSVSRKPGHPWSSVHGWYPGCEQEPLTKAGGVVIWRFRV